METQFEFDFEASVGNTELNRVKVRTADYIIEFFNLLQPGEVFYGEDLRQYVASQAAIAPGSADRIMRDLRQKGTISYTLVDRARSKYRKD